MMKMMRFISSVLFSILFCGVVLADSMMLSPAELEAIGVTTEEAGSVQYGGLGESSGHKLRLDGIIYHGDENWCVWLNGLRFSHGQHPTRYKIIKVHYDSVEVIEGNQDNSTTKPIVLRIGQVY